MGVWKGQGIAVLLVGSSASMLIAFACVPDSRQSPIPEPTGPAERQLVASIEVDGPGSLDAALNVISRDELWRSVSRYDRTLELGPSFDTLEARAAALHALGWRVEALADYTRALELREDPQAYIERGQIFLEMDQYHAAEADLQRALELEPLDSDLFDIHIGLGDAHRNLGAADTAVISYSIAIQMEPDNWVPYYWRGVSLVMLQRFSAAVDDFSQVIDYESQESNAAYFARGVLHWMDGRCELARNDLTVFGNLEFDNDLISRAPRYLEYLSGAAVCDPPPEGVSILIGELEPISLRLVRERDANAAQQAQQE